ncbi:MAG TPA: hypothetical protein VFE62_00050 [Gemmataceae bacterium]|nr:hypothetical protein [Gemmataceae bacterium]
MENEELIRQKMENTRESITEKLDALEERVVGSVQQASNAVSDTAETVKNAFDLRVQVDRHPWLMVGGAVTAGMVAGHLLQPREPPRLDRQQAPMPAPEPSLVAQPQPPPTPRSAKIAGMLEPELAKVKELAVGVTLGLVREALTADMPPALRGYAGQIIDAVTLKLGGKPLANAELPFNEKQQPCASRPATAPFA